MGVPLSNWRAISAEAFHRSSDTIPSQCAGGEVQMTALHFPDGLVANPKFSGRPLLLNIQPLIYST